MPSWLFESETLRFLQRRERKLELSAASLGWMGKYLCQVCILYWHFLCLPLSLNPGLLGDAGTFCDPVPEASFCRVGINRGDPSGELHVIHNPSWKASAHPAPETMSPTCNRDGFGQIALQ